MRIPWSATARTTICSGVTLLAVGIAVLAVGTAVAATLITESEAALPIDDSAARGVSRGPRVSVVSPPPTAGLIKSPLNLRIKFEGFGGFKINVDSVVITYRKIPPIDLTQRVTPFIKPDGIEMPSAEVPPGTHRIHVEVKDTGGRTGWIDFTFKVMR